MGRPLILETTYLIDLEREVRRGAAGPALALLEREADSPLHVTFTIAGELAAGTSLGERARWEEFLSPFRVLPATDDVCWHYGEIYRYLQRNGMLIGSNDLWIAATAVAHAMPIVTRNRAHFSRVPGVEVIAYAE
jgi:predicted nucleic acid-binding protein